MDLRSIPVLSCLVPRPVTSGLHACRVLPCIQHQKWHMPAWKHSFSSVDGVLPNTLLRSPAVAKRRKVLSGSDISCSADNLEDPVSSQDSDDTQLRIEFALPRRSRQVTFTCNVCDGRTERLVNPRAWDKGMVFVQCAHCNAWHKIRDEAGLVEEIRFVDEPASPKSDSQVDELEFDKARHDLVKLIKEQGASSDVKPN